MITAQANEILGMVLPLVHGSHPGWKTSGNARLRFFLPRNTWMLLERSKSRKPSVSALSFLSKMKECRNKRTVDVTPMDVTMSQRKQHSDSQ